jgi:hypothetical protein
LSDISLVWLCGYKVISFFFLQIWIDRHHIPRYKRLMSASLNLYFIKKQQSSAAAGDLPINIRQTKTRRKPKNIDKNRRSRSQLQRRVRIEFIKYVNGTDLTGHL